MLVSVNLLNIFYLEIQLTTVISKPTLFMCLCDSSDRSKTQHLKSKLRQFVAAVIKEIRFVTRCHNKDRRRSSSFAIIKAFNV